MTEIQPVTTERKYFCNVCREEVTGPERTYGKPGTGFDFKLKSPVQIDLTQLAAAENHICWECMDAIADAWARSQRPASDIRKMQ